MNVLLYGARMDLISGHSRPSYELAANLAAAGHRVRILSTKLRPARHAWHRALRQRETHLQLPPTERPFLRSLELLRPSREQRGILEGIGDWADIIHGFSFWSTNLLLAQMPSRLPALLSLNTKVRPAWKELWSREQLREMVAMRRSAFLGRVTPATLLSSQLRRFHRVISWTRFLREEIIALGVSEQLVARIPLGINLRRFPDWRQPVSGAPKLLYFGLLTPARGALDVLRGFAQFLQRAPGATLALADRGHHQSGDRAYLDRQRGRFLRSVDELGLRGRVKLSGFHRDVPSLIASADLVVLPFSTAYGYSQPPLTVLEALAMGRPVISTRVSSLPEIIQNEALGLLVPPGQPGALSAAIERLWRGDGMEKREARRAWIEENCNWQDSTEAILRQYEGAIASRGGRA